MDTETYKYLYGFIDSLPVVSTHSHHLPGTFQKQLTLDHLFENSYLSLVASVPEKENIEGHDYLTRRERSYSFPGKNVSLRGDFLSNCRDNTYFIWLEKAIQRIYERSDYITPDNWDDISVKINQRHSEKNADIDILREIACYRRVILDSYWDYAIDLGHPEMFSRTMRTDMFINCFHPNVYDHDGKNPFHDYPNAPTRNFDEYLVFLEQLFSGWRNSGAVTMKSASAYDRSIYYEKPDYDLAAKVFFQSPETVTPAEHKAYGDFMFHWFCKLCIQLDVPFQIHTGLAKLSGSRPLFLEPVIAQYSDIRFVLLHVGYPWYDDSAGLAHNYSNVYLDLTWVPIISTSGAIKALSEFIDVAQSSNRIAWGDDTWTSEESFGALLAWKHTVAKVLASKVNDGYFDIKEAEKLASKLLYKNAVTLYDLP